MSKRILFYSHDTVGLGHINRTLAIAGRLTSAVPDSTALILTGSPVVQTFRLPRNVDYIKLPALRKVDNANYEARLLRLGVDDLFGLRAEIIRNAFERFRPDLFMVDKVPAGVNGELLPTLRANRRRNRPAWTVLGLRDILDTTKEVIRSWGREGTYEIADRFYDQVFLWGMKEMFDAVREYRFPSTLAEKSVYCGYVRRPDRRPGESARPRRNGRRLVLATVGGGEDGFPVLENFVRSIPRARSRFASVAVLGPAMPKRHRDEIRSLVRRSGPHHYVVDFTRNMDRFLESADLVVSMGGYNSVCEIVSRRKRLLLVPRIHPREEQLIRARRIEAEGLARVIHPDDLSPEAVAREIDLSFSEETAPPEGRLDFGGLDRAVRLLTPRLDGAEEDPVIEPLWKEAAS